MQCGVGMFLCILHHLLCEKMSRLICQAQLSLETTTEWGDVESGCATGGKAPKVNEAKRDFAHLLT